jgi:chromate transporter
VLGAFTRLGLTSFGGPIAHLAYMREEFVRRRGWLDETQFAQLLGICQFLPGPASSQMGFAIGLLRAGWSGAALAFVAFTLPSALLMFAFAALAPGLGSGIGTAAVHGLKLVAVVVVAHGVMGMARQLTPDAPRGFIAAAAASLILLSGDAWMQLMAIVVGGVIGSWVCRQVAAPAFAGFTLPYGRRTAILLLSLFALGLGLSLLWPSDSDPGPGALAAAFYAAGALVFGGGHVVLPLLQQSVVDTGWVSTDAFLAGYGAAQAVPGPMFTLAAFLGAESAIDAPPALGAVVALLAIFLPGFLLLLAVMPFWARLATLRWAAPAMAGTNAAVVGLLAAALYDPVWTQGVRGPVDMAIALVGFVALSTTRLSAIWVVAWCVAASALAFWLAP